MSSSIPSAYRGTCEHLLDNLNELFLGDEGRIPIGPETLNEKLHGLRDEFVLIYGPAGVGKTDLAINIGYAASKRVRVIMLTLELSPKGIMRRMLPLQSACFDFENRLEVESFGQISNLAKRQQEHANRVIELARDACTSITLVGDSIGDNSSSRRTAEELERAVDAYKEAGTDVLAIVDYTQLVDTDKPSLNTTDQIDKITRVLARIAHSKQVPVIAISAVDKTGKLRGSSMLNHDPDIILHLTTRESFKDHRNIEIDIEKWREGRSRASIDLTYYPSSHFFE